MQIDHYLDIGAPDHEPKALMVAVRLDSMRLEYHEPPTLEKLRESLSKIKRKYSGYVRIVAKLEYDEGDDNTLSETRMVFFGIRKETKQEVLERRRRWANRFLNERLTHVRMVRAYKGHLKKDLQRALKLVPEVQRRRHELDVAEVEAGPTTE